MKYSSKVSKSSKQGKSEKPSQSVETQADGTLRWRKNIPENLTKSQNTIEFSLLKKKDFVLFLSKGHHQALHHNHVL